MAQACGIAIAKRKTQLQRWNESDTERESLEIKNRPKRVKFADKCIFQAACAANDKAQVAKMIKDGYDINAVDEDGITALHQACIEDNLDMVEFLLKHGADVNISDNEGWTPLHAVATCCYVSIARLLLEQGANVVALNNDCSIPLDICKCDEIREMFIQDINAKGIDLKEARRGEELIMMEDAKRWLQKGYSEDAHPITGATALHVAACKGYIKVLDVIVKSGANINVKDFDGWTPLHAAAHWGQKEACEILLENKCDITIKDNCDQTALDVADSNVLPVFDQFKRKRELNNKNVEKISNSVPNTNTHIGPIIQIQSRKIPEKVQKEEDVKEIKIITPIEPNNKEATAKESNKDNHTTVSMPDAKQRTVTESSEEKSTPSEFKVPILPKSSTPISSPSTEPTSAPVSIVAALVKTTEQNVISEENLPSWRRTNSLRTKSTASPVEDVTKGQDKPPVKRTKGGELAVNDNSLRRAYSFESADPKFYTRLRDARNRIMASNLSSSATNTAILENIPTVTNHIPSPPNDSNSNNPVKSLNPVALITSKLQEGCEDPLMTRFTQKRIKDPTSPTAAAGGSPTIPNRGSQDVKVRRSFVPPTRDEESETQRKAHAKRVRETRRSTQGVTLEELKSAEQYVKNSLLGNPASTDQQVNPASTTVPATPSSSGSRKEDEASVERRPSWRLRVDEQDPSKFSLEDTRSLPPALNHPGVNDNSVVQRSSSLRSRPSNNKNEHSIHGKPPKPPETAEAKNNIDDEKEKDMKNSGAQGAILRKKKTKRRSTGIVQYNQDGTEISQVVSGSDVEVGSGSGPSSDLDQGQDSSKNENGVSSTINYKKLYEEVLKENQLLKGRIVKAEEDVADLKVKLERVNFTPRITSEDADRREKKALERKLSEMEEELKESRHLRSENQKLRDENGALIRVISKLSK